MRAHRYRRREASERVGPLAHIANSGIFPAQSLKQGTKCRISTTSSIQGGRAFRHLPALPEVPLFHSPENASGRSEFSPDTNFNKRQVAWLVRQNGLFKGRPLPTHFMHSIKTIEFQQTKLFTENILMNDNHRATRRNRLSGIKQ